MGLCSSILPRRQGGAHWLGRQNGAVVGASDRARIPSPRRTRRWRQCCYPLPRRNAGAHRLGRQHGATVGGGDRREIRRFEGHGSRLYGVAFRPDGRLAAASSGDKTVRLWEVATGREIRRLEGHASKVNAVAFSPDGTLALTGSDDNTARLWEVATGREIRRLEGGHRDPVHAVAFSPDGTLALTSWWDKTALLWEVATGHELRRLEGHRRSVNAVAFFPDGRLALTASGDGTALLWEVATGREIRRLEGDGSPVNAVTFSPDGRLALTGSEDKTAWLWEVATGRKLRWLEGHGSPVNAVAFSPDGKLVLTGSGDNTARLWDTANGQIRSTFMPLRAGGMLAFDPEGLPIYVQVSGNDDEAYIFVRGLDIQLPSELRRQGYDLPIPEPVIPVAQSNAETARLCALAAPLAPDWREYTLHSSVGYAWLRKGISIAPNGRWLATARDTAVGLWDVATGRELRRFEGHRDMIRSVAFAPDGQPSPPGSRQDSAAVGGGDRARVASLRGA